MQTEYIHKQDAINAANDWLLDCFKVQKMDRSCGLIRRLEDTPPADVAPVVHGKWIGYDDTERFTAQCNLCGNVIDTRFGSNFCPNCGAKMDA